MNGLSKSFQWCCVLVVALTTTLCWTRFGWSMEHEAESIDIETIETLDLPTAARIALAGNPSLEAAKARVEQARQAVRQARSFYFPTVGLAVSQTRVDLSDNAYETQLATNQALFGTGAAIDNPEDYYRAGIEANWLLFDGLTRYFNLTAAKHGEQSSDAAREDARRRLLQGISSAFLQAQLALENIAIARADESFNQRLLTEAKLRHEVGTGALSDVLNFEVRANGAKSERIVAERTFQTARIGLASLLGLKTARLPENMKLAPLAETGEEDLADPDLEQLLESAYASRPDLLQTDWGVRRAEANAKAKRGGYFPSLSLFAGYNGERTDDFGFEGEDFGTSVGVNLSYTIFAGGLIHARHQEAKMQLREAEKGLESLKIDVTSEVQSTAERLQSSKKQYLLQRTNARLVQRNRDLVEKEYKAGVGSLVRLNEAQRDLTAAQVRLAGAQVALQQAWSDLWSATGQIEAKLTGP